MVNTADLAYYVSFGLIGYALYGILGAGLGLLLALAILLVVYGDVPQSEVEHP